MNGIPASFRRALALLLAAVAVASLVFAQNVLRPSAGAEAADLRSFDPGYIISDTNFFDVSSMNENAVQQFLNGKVQACTRGYTCLKDYRQDTWTRSADKYCGAYEGGRSETAARIIAKVAQACGINPQVLLVTLQKEQGLVTSRTPSSTTYRIAMGYACPDTPSGCDSKYYGFFNQVFSAARQFKVYQYATNANGKPYFTAYAPGGWRTVRYSPDESCGASSVFIQNQATANLYYYTPYQPNGAALANEYQTGDDCSAYGNRNFFSYYSDWFGSPTYIVKGTIGSYYNSIGGRNSSLGEPVGNEESVDGGWKQRFSGGTLYHQPNRGVWVVKGSIRQHYDGRGEQGSSLGWPVSNERLESGAWVQDFGNGRIYVLSGDRKISVDSAIARLYLSADAHRGRLGFPRASAVTHDGVTSQEFDGGFIVSSGASTWQIVGDIAQEYHGLGIADRNKLGAPIAAEERVGGGWQQRFTGGVIYISSTQRRTVSGDIGVYYQRQGGARSAAGAPAGGEARIGSGWRQSFEKGTIYAAPSGTYFVSRALAPAYSAQGGPTGSLGWPSGDAVTVAAGSVQRFQNGHLAVSASSSYLVKGAINTEFLRGGGPRTQLGLPVENEKLKDGVWSQRFTNGEIVVAPTGSQTVQDALGRIYIQNGGSSGAIGIPTGPQVNEHGGARQEFQGGVLFTKDNVTQLVKGGILQHYTSRGGQTGGLGWPAAAQETVSGGWRQRFDGGYILDRAGVGPRAVQGEIGRKYSELGAQTGRLGWPSALERRLGSGWQQDFAGGSILVSSHGAYVLTGSIGSSYFSRGGPASQAGWPVSNERQIAGGWAQRFEAGTYYASSRGAYVVQGAIAGEFERRGGTSGELGWPTSNERWANGAWRQSFERGEIVIR